MSNVKRLIDGYDLTIQLAKRNAKRPLHYDDVLAVIADAPTVDAVEVVRCKDCVNCVNPYGIKDDYRCTVFSGCYGHPYPIRLDDFCSYGERREGE